MNKLRLILEKYSDYLRKILALLGILLLFLFLNLQIQNKKEEKNVAEIVMEEQMLDLEEKENPDLNSIENEREVDNSDQVKVEKILIDLKGAVHMPGVYEMERADRVIDCVNQAGGFLEEAEERAVNLAQRLEDQMVIYIPTKGEGPPIINQVNTVRGEVELNSPNQSKVDLNTAGKEELKKLNGIGDVKAENIISYREENGFFQKIEDIKNVSGIGDLTFDKIKEELAIIP